MENEFKIDGELFSENDNLIQENGETTEVSDVETFEGLGDILNEEEETPVEETPKAEEPKKEEPKKEVNEDTTPYQDIVSHFQSKGIFGDISEYEDEEFTFDGSEESFVELLERKKKKMLLISCIKKFYLNYLLL